MGGVDADETLWHDIEQLQRRCDADRARRFRSRPLKYLQIDTQDPGEVDLFLRGICGARVGFIWLDGEVDTTGGGRIGYFEGEGMSVDAEAASYWPRLATDLLELNRLDVNAWFEPC